MSPENQDALRRADDIERGERSGMWYESSGATAHIRRLVAGIEAERQARQAAQIENEALKARIARADVELQRAVIAEREACAKVCDELHWPWHMGDESGPKECATAIRARGKA